MCQKKRGQRRIYLRPLLCSKKFCNYPGKTVSRKARQDRKGKTTSYQALAFHPIGFGIYLNNNLKFFATFAPLRE
jgi:hypothetical protein